MELFSYPVNKDEQMKQIIDDTQELISTFKQISSLIVDKLDNKDITMYTLGKRLINHKEEQTAFEESLGCAQINIV